MAGDPSPASPSFQNELESLVFSGAYEQVIRLTAGGYSDADAPLLIGALALGGRLEEAESVFDARFRQEGASPAPASARFFLAAGWCHAGNSERAMRHVRENVLRHPSALDRYWAYQGLALVRHFEGRLSRARRAARRALSTAVFAGFSYGHFLSLDLMAHVAVHSGEIHAGMRLLAQASDLAESLGYAANASTERAAQLLFQLRFSLGLGSAALIAVKELVNASGVSYFTRRNGLLELASAHALRGEATPAAQALEESRRIALPGSDRRARVRWLIGHAFCQALSAGPRAAAASLAEAHKEARSELTLRAELGFVEAIFGGPLSAERCADLAELAALTGAERARVAALVASGSASSCAPRIEDGLCRLLLECANASPVERLRRVTEVHFLGLVPWALGVAPGRRIILLGTTLISENHGNVSLAELKNRPTLKLLAELRRGYRSRAELLRDVWSIGLFVPARHTATLHTAISRLRFALGSVEWIITHDDGYSLAPGVEGLAFGEAEGIEGPALPTLAPSLPPPDDRERVLEHISKAGPLSSVEVAKSLRLSNSTALRSLRELCARGLIEKQGGGRSTRYRRKLESDR